MIKLSCPVKEKEKIELLLGRYMAKIVQHKSDVAIIEAAGEQENIKQLLADLAKFGIKELIRTGKIAIA